MRQEAQFNALARVVEVGNQIATGTQNRSNNDLYRMKAKVITNYGSILQGEQWTSNDRHVEIIFTDMTLKQARLLVPQAEVLIMGGMVYTHQYNVGFLNGVGDPIASLNPEYTSQQGNVHANDVINGLVAACGEQHREQLEQIILRTRTTTVVQVEPQNWRITAHPGQVETAAVLEPAIEMEN